MPTSFITFNIAGNGDLFEPRIVISCKCVLGKTEKVGEFTPSADVTAIKIRTVREKVMQHLTKMLNVRDSPYVIGYLSPEQRRDINTVKMRFAVAEDTKSFITFIRYVSAFILPLMYEIRPSEASTRQKNYLTRYEALKDLCDEVEKKIKTE